MRARDSILLTGIMLVMLVLLLYATLSTIGGRDNFFVGAFLSPGSENKDATPVLTITFDTEFPVGMSLYPRGAVPENVSGGDLAELTTEEEWLKGLEKILQLGEAYNFRFQFNVVGQTAEAYPGLVKEIAAEHSISCHTYSHRNMAELSYEDQLDELSECRLVVGNIIGRDVSGNRFPYTSWNSESFRALQQAGYSWDSSVWETGAAPSGFGIAEYKISELPDDWSYYVYEGNTEDFFDMALQYIRTHEHTVIVLHPWILAKHQRMDEFALFLSRLEKEGVVVITLDDLYESAGE